MKLSNTTWVLGEKPNKTLKSQTGCWTERPRSRKDGKVGKRHSSLHHVFNKGAK